MEPFPWLWGAIPVSFPTGCVLSVRVDPVPLCLGLLLTQTLLGLSITPPLKTHCKFCKRLCG